MDAYAKTTTMITHNGTPHTIYPDGQVMVSVYGYVGACYVCHRAHVVQHGGATYNYHAPGVYSLLGWAAMSCQDRCVGKAGPDPLGLPTMDHSTVRPLPYLYQQIYQSAFLLGGEAAVQAMLPDDSPTFRKWLGLIQSIAVSHTDIQTRLSGG